MNIRTKASVGIVLLTVSAFILGGIVTYNFIPSNDSIYGPPPGPPPWSPRSGISSTGRDVPGKDGMPDQNQTDGEAERKDRERRSRIVDKWKGKLDLTEAQVEQFHDIYAAGHKKFISVEKESREQFARIRRETDEAIVEVLTTEQAVRYREIVEEFRARREAREKEEREQRDKQPDNKVKNQ